jgi:preprotein translocase subunit SecD
MKFFRNSAVLAVTLLTTIIFSSCEQPPIEHGIEYVLEAPAGTDTSIMNATKAVIDARVMKFLDGERYEVLVDGTMIKVRVEEGTIKDESVFSRMLQSSAALTFRTMYNLPEIAESINAAQLAYQEVSDVDTFNSEPYGLQKYLVPAYDPEMQNLYSAPIIGYCAPRDTGEVNAFLAIDTIAGLFPSDLKMMWGSADAGTNGEPFLGLLACKAGRNYELSGTHIVSAEYEELDWGPAVMITFDQTGSDEWAKMTKANIGRTIAIEMDGFVYSYPNVQMEITGGQAQISGSDPNEMKTLAQLLSVGQLPVQLAIVEKKTF